MKSAIIVRFALLTFVVLDFVPLVLAPQVTAAPGLSGVVSSNVTSGSTIKVVISLSGCACNGVSLSDSRGTVFSLEAKSDETYTFVGIAHSSGADTFKALVSEGNPTSAQLAISETYGTSVLQTASNSCSLNCLIDLTLSTTPHPNQLPEWNPVVLVAGWALLEGSLTAVKLPWIQRPILRRILGGVQHHQK